MRNVEKDKKSVDCRVGGSIGRLSGVWYDGMQVWSNETALVARCRRVYANAHAYHINSISNNRCFHPGPSNFVKCGVIGGEYVGLISGLREER